MGRKQKHKVKQAPITGSKDTFLESPDFDADPDVTNFLDSPIDEGVLQEPREPLIVEVPTLLMTVNDQLEDEPPPLIEVIIEPPTETVLESSPVELEPAPDPAIAYLERVVADHTVEQTRLATERDQALADNADLSQRLVVAQQLLGDLESDKIAHQADHDRAVSDLQTMYDRDVGDLREAQFHLREALTNAENQVAFIGVLEEASKVAQTEMADLREQLDRERLEHMTTRDRLVMITIQYEHLVRAVAILNGKAKLWQAIPENASSTVGRIYVVAKTAVEAITTIARETGVAAEHIHNISVAAPNVYLALNQGDPE